MRLLLLGGSGQLGTQLRKFTLPHGISRRLGQLSTSGIQPRYSG
jgi:dTDP-4-dehydrorhamnose reductase